MFPAQPMSELDNAKVTVSGLSLSTRFLNEAFTQSVTEPITFVNTILRECINLNASDILFEPDDEHVRVRARVDGVLYDLGNFKIELYASITARIKIISQLDTTEKRKAQEGQFSFEENGSVVNVRVEIVQLINDEMIVLRILQLSNVVRQLEQLGFTQTTYQQFIQILNNKSGLILVAGPTGSGKTTTLYSTIHYLNRNHEFNIVTIEDPVEYQLPGINQMPVRLEDGFTFAEGLRVTLRMTPDIILVGEIRDKNTATIAVESGLTGHMILSTIHTPDAVGVIYRLLDLGIEPYFLNASVRGVVAQRLVRKNCPQCREQHQPTEDEAQLFMKYLQRVPQTLLKGKGCEACQNLGFSGRIGIYEVLKIDGEVRKCIRNKVNEDQLRGSLDQQGYITLMKDGLLKAEAGLTTVDEVLRNSLRID